MQPHVDDPDRAHRLIDQHFYEQFMHTRAGYGPPRLRPRDPDDLGTYATGVRRMIGSSRSVFVSYPAKTGDCVLMRCHGAARSLPDRVSGVTRKRWSPTRTQTSS